jgi:hypothetical protein
MTATGVYTLLNSNGEVIYIGVSDNPASRVQDHRAKSWGDQIADWTVDWYETREQGERAEKQAIFTHQPLYNRRGVTQAGRLEVVARGPLTRTTDEGLNAIVSAWEGIARAEEHYRVTLRAGIAADVTQVEVSRRLGRTREMLRRDVMTEEQLAELKKADRERKQTK